MSSSLPRWALSACVFQFAGAVFFPQGWRPSPTARAWSFTVRYSRPLREHGIEPLVTLSHYDYPLALVERYGGWQSREMIERYAHYVETVGRAYQGLVRYWLTFNEINSVALSYLNAGVTLEDERDRAAVTAAFSHHMFMASARAVEILHKIDPANKVGCMVAAGATYPYRCAPEDVWLAYEEDRGRYFYTDVMAAGAYPAWKLRALEKEGVHVPFGAGRYGVSGRAYGRLHFVLVLLLALGVRR